MLTINQVKASEQSEAVLTDVKIQKVLTVVQSAQISVNNVDISSAAINYEIFNTLISPETWKIHHSTFRWTLCHLCRLMKIHVTFLSMERLKRTNAENGLIQSTSAIPVTSIIYARTHSQMDNLKDRLSRERGRN